MSSLISGLIFCNFHSCLRKAGWARRARVVQASLGKDTKGGLRMTQEISTWKRLDDEDMSSIDLQVLYNGYAGRWFSKPFFSGSLSFKSRGGGNWIPSLILLLMLLALAGSSFFINYVFRMLRKRKKKAAGFVPISEASSVESNDTYN